MKSLNRGYWTTVSISLTGAVLCALTLSSCGPNAVPQAPVSQRVTPTTSSTVESTEAPLTALEIKRNEVEASLSKLISVSQRPSTDQIRSALRNSGINPASTEVTATTTPTGLQADTVQIGVLIDKDCIMANIRGGKLSMATLPALTGNRCFVGGNAHE